MKFKVLIILLFGATQLSAQLSEKSMSLHLGTGLGGLAPHKSSTTHLVMGPSIKLEAGVTFRTQGDKTFQRHYKFPYYGFVYSLNSTGNEPVLGNIHAVNIFGSIPFYRADNPISFRAGIGLGYHTKKFNKYTNHKNNSIGSSLNTNIQFRIEKNFQILKGFKLNTGIGISHYSNASFTRPNLGLNFFHLYLNADIPVRHFKYPGPDTTFRIAILPYSIWEHSIVVFGGLKEVGNAFGNKYFVGALTIQSSKRLNEYTSIVGGLDNYLNFALKETENKLYQEGLFATYMKHFGKLRLGISFGGYLLNQPEEGKLIYNKVIIEYHISKRLFTQVLLKSHVTSADFFGLTLGYQIR